MPRRSIEPKIRSSCVNKILLCTAPLYLIISTSIMNFFNNVIFYNYTRPKIRI
jgi:hypothetical protein